GAGFCIVRPFLHYSGREQSNARRYPSRLLPRLPALMAVTLGGWVHFQREVSAFGHWHQHLFLAVDQRGGVIAGDLEAMAVGDGVGGAGLHAISAEDAAVVIDVVDLGVAFAAADAQLGSILGRFDIDALRRARGRAQKTSDAF